jgi:hypothetical protein
MQRGLVTYSQGATVTVQVMQTVEIVEIRARHDRNRLLGTYDPVRGVLRLFHRGETVTVKLSTLALAPDLCYTSKCDAEQ